MNFFFVDRILELVPGKQTVGLKHVTPQDTYLAARVSDKLALFPCVVGEALGQLCSWNVLKTTDFRFRPVGGVIQEIHMHAEATLGDTILLESDIEELDPENQVVRFSGRASVQGKTLLTVSNSIAPLMPLQDFNHLHQVQTDFENLMRVTEETPIDTSSTPTHLFPLHYDTILSSQAGQEIIALKNVALSTPYFADHFPKKPVLPLSLLMEYNLHLAHSFFAEATPGKILHPRAVRKVKIGNFVLPGDEVTTRITLKEQRADSIVLSFHNAVENKKVCVAEAEFGLT